HQPGHPGVALQGLLDELDVPPVEVGETAGVVIAVAAEDGQAGAPRPLERVVPLPAGDLAGLAAGAHGGVGEETNRLPGHVMYSRAGSDLVRFQLPSPPYSGERGWNRGACSHSPSPPTPLPRVRGRGEKTIRQEIHPLRTLQTNTLASWMVTFGSPTRADR